MSATLDRLGICQLYMFLTFVCLCCAFVCQAALLIAGATRFGGGLGRHARRGAREAVYCEATESAHWAAGAG